MRTLLTLLISLLFAASYGQNTFNIDGGLTVNQVAEQISDSLANVELDELTEIAAANQINDTIEALDNVVRTGEVDPIFAADSLKVLHWADTTTKVASQYDLGGITNLRGDLTIAGNLKYGFIHAVGSVDATSYTPVVTQNIYTKLVPSIIWREEDGVHCHDSVQILTTGDYRLDISIALSATNVNDFWRIKIYKNGAAYSPELGRFRWRSMAANITDTRSYFWYLIGCTANDWISFRITNETGSRNPTITDFKVYLEQKPE